VVHRSFVQTDTRFAERCSLQSSLSSGTTALTAMIFGRFVLDFFILEQYQIHN
jgi:protein phosphatase PTC2/3